VVVVVSSSWSGVWFCQVFGVSASGGRLLGFALFGVPVGLVPGVVRRLESLGSPCAFVQFPGCVGFFASVSVAAVVSAGVVSAGGRVGGSVCWWRSSRASLSASVQLSLF
jgi:hypothetical protein